MFLAQALAEYGLFEAVFQNLRFITIRVADTLYGWGPVQYGLALLALVVVFRIFSGRR